MSNRPRLRSGPRGRCSGASARGRSGSRCEPEVERHGASSCPGDEYDGPGQPPCRTSPSEMPRADACSGGALFVPIRHSEGHVLASSRRRAGLRRDPRTMTAVLGALAAHAPPSGGAGAQSAVQAGATARPHISWRGPRGLPETLSIVRPPANRSARHPAPPCASTRLGRAHRPTAGAPCPAVLGWTPEEVAASQAATSTCCGACSPPFDVEGASSRVPRRARGSASIARPTNQPQRPCPLGWRHHWC